MKPTLMLLGLSMIFGIAGGTGCSSSDDSRDAKSSVRDVLQGGRESADGVENTCLLAYATRYDELLPLSLAAEVAGLPADQAKAKYSKAMSNPAYQQLQYAWPSDRVRSVAISGREMSVPRDDVMGLGGMAAQSRERFLQTHRPVTDEDREAFDRAIENSDEEALQSEQAKELASGFGGVMAEISQGYRDVSGIGQAATYNTAESMLYVHDRGVSFSVLADLSDEDHDGNQAKAVEAARRILARCP